MLGRVVLMGAAAGAAFMPWPAWLVEWVYAERAYPWWSHAVGSLTAAAPVAVFDVLCVALACWLAHALWRVVAPVRGGRIAALFSGLGRTLSLACVVYLVFWAGWGLNYARPTLEQRLDFDRERIRPERVDRLAVFAVDRLNELDSARRARPWPSLAEAPEWFGPAFRDTVTLLGVPAPPMTPAPKPTLLAYYFRWAAIDGLTSPFTQEVLVNPYVIAPERPMVVVHEWAHVAGFARESEANYVAMLTCLRGDLHMQYSAWLSLLPQALTSLAAERRKAIAARLGEGPRADFAAIAARARDAVPAVRRAAWRSYDSYLRAHRVETGVDNYGEALALLLGTHVSDDWELPAVPALR